MEVTFNSAIRKIRKEKGITQEQLADAVGVSPQAVSKWEMSSFPDAQLLPVIADFLGVSIDELYGRDRENEIGVNQRVVDYIRETDHAEKFTKMFNLCLAALQGYVGGDEYVDMPDRVRGSVYESYNLIVQEEGWAQARLNENLWYFLLMPQPEKGYDDVLVYDQKTEELFRILAMPNALRTAYFFADREKSTFFTVSAVSAELEIPEESARSILEGLEKIGLIWGADLNSGGERTEKAYQYLADQDFVAFITFARNLVRRPCNFINMSRNRNSPFFKNNTYKKAKEGEKDEEK